MLPLGLTLTNFNVVNHERMNLVVLGNTTIGGYENINGSLLFKFRKKPSQKYPQTNSPHKQLRLPQTLILIIIHLQRKKPPFFVERERENLEREKTPNFLLEEQRVWEIKRSSSIFSKVIIIFYLIKFLFIILL